MSGDVPAPPHSTVGACTAVAQPGARLQPGRPCFCLAGARRCRGAPRCSELEPRCRELAPSCNEAACAPGSGRLMATAPLRAWLPALREAGAAGGAAAPAALAAAGASTGASAWTGGLDACRPRVRADARGALPAASSTERRPNILAAPPHGCPCAIMFCTYQCWQYFTVTFTGTAATGTEGSEHQ